MHTFIADSIFQDKNNPNYEDFSKGFKCDSFCIKSFMMINASKFSFVSASKSLKLFTETDKLLPFNLLHSHP